MYKAMSLPRSRALSTDFSHRPLKAVLSVCLIFCLLATNLSVALGNGQILPFVAPAAGSISSSVAPGVLYAPTLNNALPPTLTLALSPESVKLNNDTTLTFTLTNPNNGALLSGVAFTSTLPAQITVAPTPATSNTCNSGSIAANPNGGTITVSGVTLGAGVVCNLSVKVRGVEPGEWTIAVTSVTSVESGTTNINSSTQLDVTTVSNAVVVRPIPYGTVLGFNKSPERIYSLINGSLSVLDTNTYTMTKNIISTTSMYFAQNNISKRLYISNGATNSVTIIDATNDSFITNVNVGVGPTRMAVNEATNRIYVANQNNSISVIDGNSNFTIASIPLDFTPDVIVVNPNTNRLYASEEPFVSSSNKPIGVVDLTTNTLIDKINLPHRGVGLAISPATNRLYTFRSDNVNSRQYIAEIDAATYNVVKTVEIAGSNLVQLQVRPAANRLYLLDHVGGVIFNLDTLLPQTIITLPGSAENLGITLQPDKGLLFVTDVAKKQTFIMSEATATLEPKFTPISVNVGVDATLTFKLHNPNTVILNNVRFTNNLPAQLKVAANPQITNTCGNNNGTVTAPGGSGTIDVTGIRLTANQTCEVSLKVTAVAAGNTVNTINFISSNEGGTAPINERATLEILPVGAPGLALAFSPNTIPANGTTNLNFTFSNQNPSTALQNVAVTVTLPSQLTIATSPEIVNECSGGTITAASGNQNITVGGVNLPIGAICTVSVKVTSASAGNWIANAPTISANESGTSNVNANATLLVTVNNPLPNLTSFYPASAQVGGNAFLLTVNGTNFVNGSVVHWNGSGRPTTYVSDRELVATVTANDIAAVGTASVTVVNPTPGGGTSVAQDFQITTGGNLVPTLTNLNPTAIRAGGASVTLNVSGRNFVNGAIVQWNGNNRLTTFVNATTLTVQINALDIVEPGVGIVTVLNPTPGGGFSNLSVVSILPATNPVPTTTSLGLTEVSAGGASFSLIVNGTNFNGGSQVRWNGSDRTTTYISSTQLLADISGSDIAATGSGEIQVFNTTPGGGLSNAQTLNIVANCLPEVVSSLSDGSSCGTLRAALTSGQPGLLNSSGKTVKFALLRSNTIVLTSSLSVPPGTTLNGFCTPEGAGVMLKGSNGTNDSLILQGNNTLRGLNISGFGNRQLLIGSSATGNRLSCVTITNS
jgi:YVTN family beta-propeller protein